MYSGHAAELGTGMGDASGIDFEGLDDDNIDGFFGSIVSAVSSVAKVVVSPVTFVAGKIGLGGVVNAALSIASGPFTLATDIASGKNVFKSLSDRVKNDIANARTVAPYAKAVLTMVPGVGTGVAAALSAGVALAEGQSITDALVAGVKGAIPGGALAQQAFDTSYKMAFKGQSLTTAALGAMRSQLPKGAQAAFDVGLAMGKGKAVQQVASASGVRIGPTSRITAAEQAALDHGGRSSPSSPKKSTWTKAQADAELARIRALRPSLGSRTATSMSTGLSTPAKVAIGTSGVGAAAALAFWAYRIAMT